MSISRTVRKLIPLSIKTRYKRYIYWFSRSHQERFEVYRNKRKIIVTMAADYGNIGDIAITYAQTLFLQSCFPELEIIDFPISSTFTNLKTLKQVCSPDDIITTIGGGNMGDLYCSIEDCRRFIIKNFPNNKIISFPQTMDFRDDSLGQQELERSKAIYGQHKNLHIFAREPVSYDAMKRAFPHNQVYLVPDIVLSLDYSETERNRRGVILCIRSDKESMLSIKQRTLFLKELLLSIPNIIERDTHNGQNHLSQEDRLTALFDLLDNFRRSEVVVTDRLHGMIFAAITKTPCVVLKNNTHKIKATYDAWLHSLEHISLQEDFCVDRIIHEVERLRKLDRLSIKQQNLSKHFEPLKKAVFE